MMVLLPSAGRIEICSFCSNLVSPRINFVKMQKKSKMEWENKCLHFFFFFSCCYIVVYDRIHSKLVVLLVDTALKNQKLHTFVTCKSVPFVNIHINEKQENYLWDLSFKPCTFKATWWKRKYKIMVKLNCIAVFK